VKGFAFLNAKQRLPAKQLIDERAGVAGFLLFGGGIQFLSALQFVGRLGEHKFTHK
jgi:hypothetical protein